MWPPRTGRRVLAAAFVLLALLVCGVSGYALFEFSLPDAVYMTVMTLTTEGFSATWSPTPAASPANCGGVGAGVYMAIMSLDPTGQGRKRWTMRWKAALQAFDDGLSAGRR